MSEGSPFVRAHLATLRGAAALGPIADVACGRGRNAVAIAADGIPVVGLDRDAGHLAELAALARARALPIRTVRTDLEAAPHLPLAPGRFGAVVVCRYLHRPLAAALVALLAPGGWLLYETFTIHQRELGYGPRSAAFLLEPDELPGLFPGLAIREHWEGRTDEARPAAMARVAARKPA